MDEQQKKKAERLQKTKLNSSNIPGDTSNGTDSANLRSSCQLVERKKKGIAVIVTLGAAEPELLWEREAAEFAREQAEVLLQAGARLVDESTVGTNAEQNGLHVKEFCFIKHTLELF